MGTVKVLLMYSTHQPSAGHRARLEAAGCSVGLADSEASALRLAADAEVVFGHRYLRQILPHAPRLRWVQSTGGRVDNLPLGELAQRGILVSRSTCMSGLIARHAHTLAWALTRGLGEFFHPDRGWEPRHDWRPLPRKAMVLGTGTIGAEILRLVAADGVDVCGVNRSTPAWRSALPDTDWVFLTLPLTTGTAGFFDRDALAALPPTASLILVGRPETLDFDALCDALAAGRLGAAAFDVLRPEWKDRTHPIWRTPRLWITPHVAAHAAERGARQEAEAEEQLARYRRGEDPEHLVRL
jgi:phosphoglycerate dehydrogenase-like enzyme